MTLSHVMRGDGVWVIIAGKVAVGVRVGVGCGVEVGVASPTPKGNWQAERRKMTKNNDTSLRLTGW